MRDLTQGSIPRHLGKLAGFMLVGMVFQTLYFLVDLYFVAELGSGAIAGVGLAGNIAFASLALTQTLTVGTTTLVAQALGAKHPREARRVFNQSQVLAMGVGVAFVAATLLGTDAFASTVTADAETAAALRSYLTWFLPSLGVQFLFVAMAAALRGAGEVRAPMLVQVASLVVNILLAPVLIAGWGTGRPLGAYGAGLATFVAVIVGALLLVVFLRRRHEVLTFDFRDWKPDFALWRRMLAIGLPAGGEFMLMFVYSTVIYTVIAQFGADAQAAFGIGMRIIQTGFMPAVAIAFSVSPIAAQNFGARNAGRVRGAMRAGLTSVAAIMLVFTALCHISPMSLVGVFTADANVIAIGTVMLGILSYNFVASGVVLVAGGVFQAIGNTLPSLAASATRMVLFAIPAVWMSRQAGFQLVHLWWLSVGSVLVQMSASLLLLRRELRRKLDVPAFLAPASSAA